MRTSNPGCAFVTGASRGIGAAIAVTLAARLPVAVGFRTGKDLAAAVCEQIESAGGEGFPVEIDVTSGPDIESAFACLERRYSHVDVLINNAGLRSDTLVLDMTDEQWDEVLATNLTAAFRITRRALMPMIRARHGRVVNIASVVGTAKGNAGQANYAASKAGLVAFTRTVAAEVGRRNVTVNAVAPGVIETDFVADLPKDLRSLIPQRRYGTAQEVADAVEFLVSERAGYINGAVLTIDGGLTA